MTSLKAYLKVQYLVPAALVLAAITYAVLPVRLSFAAYSPIDSPESRSPLRVTITNHTDRVWPYTNPGHAVHFILRSSDGSFIPWEDSLKEPHEGDQVLMCAFGYELPPNETTTFDWHVKLAPPRDPKLQPSSFCYTRGVAVLNVGPDVAFLIPSSGSYKLSAVFLSHLERADGKYALARGPAVTLELVIPETPARTASGGLSQ